MRIPTSSFPNALVSQLQQLAERQNRLQNQAATGQRVQQPSDDPAAMRRVMDLQAESTALTQYQNNTVSAQEVAQATFTAIKGFKTTSDRANEIATLAGGVTSNTDLTTYVKEVNELIKEGLANANTKHQGNYLFGGTKTDQPPFEATYDSEGNVLTVTYKGNSNLAETEVMQDVSLSARVPGANTTGSGAKGLLTDSRTGADFFNHLLSLRDHLASGDKAAVMTTDSANLRVDENNLINHLGSNGAVQARLETAASLSSARSLSLEKLVSREADADLTQTIVRLNETQTAYQAALQSGGKILNQSLLDYLR